MVIYFSSRKLYDHKLPLDVSVREGNPIITVLKISKIFKLESLMLDLLTSKKCYILRFTFFLTSGKINIKWVWTFKSFLEYRLLIDISLLTCRKASVCITVTFDSNYHCFVHLVNYLSLFPFLAEFMTYESFVLQHNTILG